MTGHTVSLQYRRAALQQASVVGLVVALHDTLVGNLTRAADAISKSDIQARCDELCHGFKVLHQLDAMLDMKNGGDTAVAVRRFYTHIRGQMLTAQFKLSASCLKEAVQSVLEVRQAWHHLDSAPTTSRFQSQPAYASLAQQEDRQYGDDHTVSFNCMG